MSPANSRQFKGRAGFTLIELLIVIAIIGILSGMVMVSFDGAKDKARIAKSLQFSNSVQNAIGVDMVGRWNFEKIEEGKVIDTSGYGNDGVVHGATLVPGLEQLGNALNFDGVDDYVEISDSPSLDGVFGTENFTLEVWVYPQDWVNYRGIINKRQNAYYSATPGGLFSDVSGIRFIIGTGNPAESASILTYKPSLNQWHHIAAIANKTNMYLYVDGQLRSKMAITLDPPPNDETLCIGSFYQTNRSFLGYIDEVRIYGQPMQISQVVKNYLAGLDKLLASGQITEDDYQQRIAELNSNYVARK